MSSTFACLIKLISLYQLIIWLQFSQLTFFMYIVSYYLIFAEKCTLNIIQFLRNIRLQSLGRKPGIGRDPYYSSSALYLIWFEKKWGLIFCIHLLLRLLSFSWLQFSADWFTTFLIIHQGVVCGLQMTLYRKKFVWKSIYFSICTSIIFLDNEGNTTNTYAKNRGLGYSHYISI